jgi:hypothetical protein
MERRRLQLVVACRGLPRPYANRDLIHRRRLQLMTDKGRTKGIPAMERVDLRTAARRRPISSPSLRNSNLPTVALSPEQFSVFVHALRKTWLILRAAPPHNCHSEIERELARALTVFILSEIDLKNLTDPDSLALDALDFVETQVRINRLIRGRPS